MLKDNLTDKQYRFCHEYMVDSNATQAAIRAGYSEDTAGSIGSENLKKPNISEYIVELREKAQKRAGISVDRILNEYAKVAFFDIRKIYNDDGSLLPIQEIDSESAGAIAGMETYEENEKSGEETFNSGTVRKVKIADKIRALDSLGKHFGIFEKDNQQKQLEINNNIDISHLTFEQLKELKYGKPGGAS